MANRRSVSPLRMAVRTELDPREQIIRKIKDDLIVARGREKELALLENYLVDLIEKTKLLSAETARTDEEGRLRLQTTIKAINEHKKEVDVLRNELKNINVEMNEVEEEDAEIRKRLNSRLVEIDNLKREGVSIHTDNEKLLNEHYRLKGLEDDTIHQIKKLSQTVRDYEARVSDITRKIMEAKAFVNEMTEENLILKDKLKKYEQQNTGIGNDIDQKENKIDVLGRTFADKHEQIKNQVESYIELEHLNEKNIKETRHKINLSKIENEKFNELSLAIRKTEKIVGERQKELNLTLTESNEIKHINGDFFQQNSKLKEDLAFCQEHLQNLLKHNAFIQQEMQNYVRQDEAIISIIRKKRLFPVAVENYQSLRASRNEGKYTATTMK